MKTKAVIIRILDVFVNGEEIEAKSISEIARAIRAAYPHTHNSISQLIKEGILNKKVFGRSTYCSPALENPLTRALMCYTQKNNLFETITPHKKNILQELDKLTLQIPEIIATIATKDGANKLQFIITQKKAIPKILQLTHLNNIMFYTPKEFQEQLLEDYTTVQGTTMTGYDRVLLLITPIAKQLFINHAQILRTTPELEEVIM